MSDINRVVLTGRLTKDPELKSLSDSTSVLAMRLAFSTRRKDPNTGEWGDQSNFIDVSLFGNRADSLSRILEKGRLIGVEGRLRWREWETPQGERRSAIDIAADNVELLGGKGESGGSGAQSYAPPAESAPETGEEIPF